MVVTVCVNNSAYITSTVAEVPLAVCIKMIIRVIKLLWHAVQLFAKLSKHLANYLEAGLEMRLYFKVK
jgi:hypothetical protein